MGNTVSAMPTNQPISSRNPRICPKPWRKNPFSHSHSYRMGQNPRAPHSRGAKSTRPNAVGHAQRGLPGAEGVPPFAFFLSLKFPSAPHWALKHAAGVTRLQSFPALRHPRHGHCATTRAAPPAGCWLLAAGWRNRSTAQFPIPNSQFSDFGVGITRSR